MGCIEAQILSYFLRGRNLIKAEKEGLAFFDGRLGRKNPCVAGY